MTVRSARDSLDVVQRGVMPEIKLPEPGRQQVSGSSPN
jgi:hypothetical protein